MIELCTGVIIGLVCGAISKGINITVVHKSVDTVDKPAKYNESMVKHLPSEVQQYYHSTNGMNKF